MSACGSRVPGVKGGAMGWVKSWRAGFGDVGWSEQVGGYGWMLVWGV